MSKLTYAVIGVGGIGGYYGAKLQNAGFDVNFLARSDYGYIKNNGITLESVQGNIRLEKVKVFNDPSRMPLCDVVLVATKTTATPQLKGILPQITSPNSTVILMQNGIGYEEQLQDYINDGEIAGGLCFICSSKIGPGKIHHRDYGRVGIAKFHPTQLICPPSDKMLQIESDFKSADISIILGNNLRFLRWQKLVWNVPFNGLCVLLNCQTDQLLANTSTRELVKDLMKEVQAGAAGEGVNISDEFIDNMIIDTQKMVPYKPSMMLDYESKRPMEIDAIYGNPFYIAMKNGIEMPKTKMLHDCLKLIEQKNLAR